MSTLDERFKGWQSSIITQMKYLILKCWTPLFETQIRFSITEQIQEAADYENHSCFFTASRRCGAEGSPLLSLSRGRQKEGEGSMSGAITHTSLFVRVSGRGVLFWLGGSLTSLSSRAAGVDKLSTWWETFITSLTISHAQLWGHRHTLPHAHIHKNTHVKKTINPWLHTHKKKP